MRAFYCCPVDFKKQLPGALFYYSIKIFAGCFYKALFILQEGVCRGAWNDEWAEQIAGLAPEQLWHDVILSITAASQMTISNIIINT